MAFRFGAAGFVNHGSGATLDNLLGPAGALTVWGWFRRGAVGGNQHLITKDNAYPTGWSFLIDDTPGEGTLRFVGFPSTVDAEFLDYRSVAGAAGANALIFGAAVIDMAVVGAGRVKLYTASLLAPPAEVAYSLQQNNTGNLVDDSAASLYVGNLQRATAFPLKDPGQMHRGGLVARALTLPQLTELYFKSREADPAVVGAIANTRLTFDYAAAGAQADASGSGNAGATSGVTLVNHMPLGRPLDDQLWSAPVPFTTGQRGIVTAGPDRLHAFALEAGTLRHRMSLDWGLTWTVATTLAVTGYPFQSGLPLYLPCAADGTNVWVMSGNAATSAFRVFRSTDSGVTWDAGTALAGYAITADGGQRVQMAADSGYVYIFMGIPGAVPDATFQNYLWRSADNGATWGALQVITPFAAGEAPSPGGIVASGANVYVAYAGIVSGVGTLGHRARMTQSADFGATWSAPVDISGPPGVPNIRPRPEIVDGRLIAIWEEPTDHNSAAPYPNATLGKIRSNTSLNGGSTYNGIVVAAAQAAEPNYYNHPETAVNSGRRLYTMLRISETQSSAPPLSDRLAFVLSRDAGLTWTPLEIIADDNNAYESHPHGLTVGGGYVHASFGAEGGFYTARRLEPASIAPSGSSARPARPTVVVRQGPTPRVTIRSGSST